MIDYDMTREEMICKIRNCAQWDEVQPEVEFLAKWYDIPLKNELGEWKYGDEMLAEIEKAFRDEMEGEKRKLETMPYDMTFELPDGRRESMHATGFEVCFDGKWWKEFYSVLTDDYYYGN